MTKEVLGFEQSYEDLKANYKGTLDEQDIEEAFNHDQPIKTAEGQFKKLRSRMIGLWVAMIIGLGLFTGILYMNRNLPKESDAVNRNIETEMTMVLPSEGAFETENPDDDSTDEKNGEEQMHTEQNGE